MGYKVSTKFKDKSTGHIYNVGDTYPARGKVTKARVAELTKKTGPNENFKAPVIEEVVDETKK